MALTATATQGLEFYRYVQENELIYVPGDPGDTYTRGDAVTATVGEGVVDPAAADEAIFGTVAQTTVCAAATVAAPRPGDMNAPHDATATLIPLYSAVPAGTPIYLVTFASHIDEVVLGYTAATPSFLGTTGAAADDYPNGALVCVYEGPGIGEVGVVADYDHADHADGALNYIMHRKFATDLTTSSKAIVLAGEAAGSRGVGFFNRTDLADANNIAVNDGANDGKLMVYMDWRDSYRFLSTLKLPVIRSSSMVMA